MSKEISLKLCLLTSLVEKPEEEIEKEVLPSTPKNNCAPGKFHSVDKKNSLSAGSSTRNGDDKAQ